MVTKTTMVYPKPSNWDEFEDIVWDLFRQSWLDPDAQRYGRSGQEQHGIDVYGRPKEMGGNYAGVQCKRYEDEKLTETIIRGEIDKVETGVRDKLLPFTPVKFIIATTASRDVKLQNAIEKIRQEREKVGAFAVALYFWEDLTDMLASPGFEDILYKHYPTIPHMDDRIMKVNSKDLKARYLQFLTGHYRALDFKGIPQLETFSRELLLEDVYVPLVARPELPAGETLERRLAGRDFDQAHLKVGLGEMKTPKNDRPIAVEQAIAIKEHTRLVVVGDPGSGKSTLLKHLTLKLASQRSSKLPILIPLNAFAAALDQGDTNLQAFLPRYFAGLSQELLDLGRLFNAVIHRGRALILLDGLDEVQKERPRLVQKVEAFAADCVREGCHVVVTSRIVGYRDAPLSPQDWVLYTLLDFDRDAIELFAKKWCTAFERSTLGDTPEAQQAAELERVDLLRALDATPGVQKLAANPLLLTILALIKRQGVSLPNRRVELYELYLKTLISAWSKARSLDRRRVGPEMDYQEILMSLAPLALWLREENPTAGLVSETALLEWLTRVFMGEDWGLALGPAKQRGRGFLDSVHTYSNLLLERGPGQYGFMHLTFEEMLAAYGLYFRGQLNLDFSLEVIRRHLADPIWRETILLAVGIWGLANKQPRVAGELVRRMLKMDCCEEDAGQNVLLAGACLEDVGELGIGRMAAQEVTGALLAACRDRSLSPFVQRDAGFILGRTGWVPDDLDEFIEIPPRVFIYQDGEKRRMEQPFAIGKYPVTNRQFRLFLEDGGHENERLWSQEGWQWQYNSYRRKHDFWNDPKWNNPLAPVVGVNVYEAEAYCKWHSQKMGKRVRLPTEEEWERAARFTDGREYTWSGGFKRDHMNCAEFWGDHKKLLEHRSTTIVLQFPEGCSQEGIFDLNGNVWEWTGSTCEWAGYVTREARVVRGGSWNNIHWDCRCGFRDWTVPSIFSDDIGFRVVLSLANPES